MKIDQTCLKLDLEGTALEFDIYIYFFCYLFLFILDTDSNLDFRSLLTTT